MIERVRNHPKKGVNFTNIYIKKSTKIISILVVLLLISTVVSSVVSSFSISSKFGELQEETEKPFKKLLDGKSIIERIRERLETAKEKFREKISERLARLKNDYSDEMREKPVRRFSNNPLINTIRTLSEFKKGNALLYLHTNYKGNEIDTQLKLFGTTKVDVDDDGDDDISARLLLYPWIERPLALSINFRLIIKRLKGFEDLDADFEVYVEFSFPGTLRVQWKGDRVRFGYQSPDGEKVPDSCIVTYKLIPYFLSKKKVETKVAINPKSSADKDNITLIFSIADMNNTKVSSEVLWEVSYNPVVKSEITIGSTGDLERSRLKIESSKETKVAIYRTKEKEDGSNTGCGLFIEHLPKNVEFEYEMKIRPLTEGTRIEYDRVSNTHVDVMLFIKNGPLQQLFGTSANFYIKYIPNHFRFTSDLLGLVGGIEIDTFDESIDEIGWCDDLFESKQWLYFADLPTEGEVNWDFRLEGGLKMYVDTMGVSLNAHLVDDIGGVFDLVVSSHDNINFSAIWDIPLGYFRLDRSGSSIDIDVSMHNEQVDLLEVSATLYLVDDTPFIIDGSGLFGEYPDPSVVIKSGCDVEITRFYLNLNEWRDDDRLMREFEVDIRDIYLDIDRDKTRSGSIIFVPFTPRLYWYLTGETSLLDSIYISITVTSHCSLSIGSCNIDIVSETVLLPTVNITNLEAGQVVRGIYTIEGTATPGDPSRPVQRVQVKIGDGSWEDVTGTTSWSYVWDTTEYPDGEYTVQVRAYDGTYYSRSKEIKEVEVDNIISPTVVITYPGKEDTISDVVTITGTATPGDPSRPITFVQVAIDVFSWENLMTRTWENATGTTSWSYVWDTKTVPNDNYTIAVRCFDTGGYEARTHIYVFTDNGPEYNLPTVRIDHPSYQNPFTFGSIVVSDIVTIDGVSSPGYSGRPVQQVQITIIPVYSSGIQALLLNLTQDIPLSRVIEDIFMEAEWINVTGTTDWSYEWDTSDISLGYYYIYARSYDGRYYSALGDPVTAIVNNINVTLIEDSVVIDIYRSRGTSVNITDFQLTAEHTPLDGSPADAVFSFDSLEWDASDKASQVSIIWDKKEQMLTVSRTKMRGTLEVNDIRIEGYNIPISNVSLVDITIRVDRLIIENTDNTPQTGNLTVQFNAVQGAGTIMVQCKLVLTLGVELYGVYLRLNNRSYWNPELHLVGPIIFECGLNISYQDVTWDIAQDFSWGWIKVGGNGYIFIDVNMDVYRDDEFCFTFAGLFYFENGNDSFDISWETVEDDKKTIFVDGSASMSITDFSLIAGDFIDISIPIFTGRFSVYIDGTLADPGSEHLLSNGSGEISLYIDEAQGSGSGGITLNTDVNLDLSQLLGFACSFTLSEADIDLGASGQIYGEAIVKATFNESGITSFTCTGDGEISGYADGYVKVVNFDIGMDGFIATVDQIIVYGGGSLSISADGVIGYIEGLSGDIAGGIYVGGSLGVEFRGLSLSASGLTASAGLLGLYISGSVGGDGVIEFVLNETLEIDINAGGGVGGSIVLNSVRGSAGSLSLVLGSLSLTASGSAHVKINGDVVSINSISVNLSGSISGLIVNFPQGSFWVGSASFGAGGFLADLSLSYLSVGFSGSVTNLGIELYGDNGCLYVNLGHAHGSGSFSMGGSTVIAHLNNVVVNDLEGSVSFENDEYIIEGSINAGGGLNASIYYYPNKWVIDVQGGASIGVTDVILEAKNKFRVTMPSAQISGSVTIEGSSTSKYVKMEGDIYLGAGIYATFIPQQLTIGISVQGQIDGDVKVSWTGTSPKFTSVRLQSTNGLYFDPYRNLTITINGEEFLNWNVDLDRNFDFHADQIFYNSDDKLVGLHLTTDCSTTRTGTITIIQEYSIIITSGGQLTGDIGIDGSSYSSSNKQIQVYSNTGFDFTFPSLEIQINELDIVMELSLIGIDPGEVTVTWGYMPGQANCVKFETTNGFSAYFLNFRINNEVIFEIKFNMLSGTSLEYKNWHSGYQNLASAKEIIFNGQLTLDICRITMGGETATITGTFTGSNARILRGTTASDSDVVYLLLQSSATSTASGITFTAPNVNLGGTASMNGKVEIKIDKSYGGSSTGKMLSLSTLNSNNGFDGSVQLTMGNIEIGGSINLESGGSGFTSFDIPIEQDVTKYFGMTTDPNSFINSLGITLKVGQAGVKISQCYNIWADNFILWWDFILPGIKWGHTGDIGANPIIEATEDGGSTWDKIWPLGNQEPVADPGGPYSAPVTPANIIFDLSNCYDPDGDQITHMRWNWGYDLTWDTDWIPFELTKTHTYHISGVFTAKLQIRDERGKDSTTETTTVTIGSDIVRIEGHIYDSDGGLVTSDDNAEVEVVGENYGSFVNAWGVYVLDLEGGRSYTLRVTADGYITHEETILADTDKTIDFYLDKGYLNIELFWDDKENGEPLYEDNSFRVYVKNAGTGQNVHNAEVTYYKYTGALLHPWDAVTGQTNPKYTNYVGYTKFTAISVSSGSKRCKVEVTHPEYQGVATKEFYVYHFTEPNQNPTINPVSDKIISENLQIQFFISAYDPEEDYPLNFQKIGGPGTLTNHDDTHARYTFTPTPVDQDTTYTIKIRATDTQGNWDEETFKITVKDSGPCFLAGTKILMANSNYRSIEQLLVGDLVKSFDENTGEVVISTITKIMHHSPEEMADHYLIINDGLCVTPNHPMYVNKEWLTADMIKIGDMLLNNDGKFIPVFSIQKVYERVPTFNLEIKNTHTYFAENILVHNGTGK